MVLTKTESGNQLLCRSRASRMILDDDSEITDSN